jgi:tripartite ATP-independent transporter DctP family solute receptor
MSGLSGHSRFVLAKILNIVLMNKEIMMVKKFRSTMGVAFVLCAFFAVFSVQQAFSATYNWKLAHEELQDGFMDTFAKEFKKKLAEKSNGEINLEIYPSGTLGTSEDLVNLVQGNVIQFNLADAGHLGSLIPEVQALLLQYLFPKDMDVVKDVLNKGKFMDLLGEKFRKMDLEPLANLTEGWQVWTTNKPIHSPEDFKGFKMRTMTSRLLVENYKAYGCNPTPMPYAEVYSGLQLNMIEGQFNPLNCTSDMKFYEVQDYLIFAYTNPFILTFIANKDFFDALPADIRKMVSETAKELIPSSFEWQEKFNQKKLEGMLENKPSLKVIRLTEDEIGAFRKLALPVRETYFKIAGPDGKKILDALEADIAKMSAK